ncbi:hypothetical protein BC938DRAFT_480180 [Jimgerdemannia flammicorona]|uniref:Uncharacterized protein n=1 Tax=Jimgerdemannia flammicorona TaxID=994334 RepID=A0A433QJ83_9FUNG|nr:hypothetical protein BC938DRAFT_480180 [Jimgerdemannia flammicorona]
MSLVDENLFVSQYLHLLSQRAVRYAADHAPSSPSFSPKLKKSVQPPGDAIEQKTAVEPVPEIQQPGDMGLTYRGSARVRETAFWVNLRKTLGQEFVDQGDAEKVLVEFMGLYKEILGKLTPIEIEAIVGGSK